jgi:hypothetical protein
MILQYVLTFPRKPLQICGGKVKLACEDIPVSINY